MFEDRETVARLLARNGLSPHTEEHWRRLWSSNPALGAFPEPPPIGWVLVADDRVVGYLGNIPMLYEFEGRTLTAAATHAWAVDPAHRNRAILLVQQFLRQTGVDLLLNTTASFEASRVFEALRVPRVPTPHYDVALAWITGPIGVAKSTLRHRGVPLAGLLGYPIGVGLALQRLGKRSGRASSAAVRRLSFSEPGFDGLVGDFWPRLKHQDSRLLAHRDPASLRWRLADPSTRIYTIGDDDGHISSWAIVVDEDNEEIGLRRRRLIDVRSTGDDGREAVRNLLRGAVADCRRDGVHVLEAIGFAGATRSHLEALAEHRRQLPTWMFFYVASDPELAARLARPEAWDPCFFDGDGVL